MRLSFALLLIAACADPTAQSIDEIGTRYGVDYAWARPDLGQLHAAGYNFAARYLSYQPNGKNLSASEAQSLQAAGFDIVSVWEQNADDALSGFNLGVNHAQNANAELAQFGGPADAPIYFAVDFDATPGDQPAIDAYFDGVASVIGRERTGGYGGYYVVQRLFDDGKIAYGWQTYAWSGGQWDARAQLRQIQNGIWGGGLDEDEAVADDFGQWGGQDTGPAPAPPPLPTQCGVIEPGHGLARGQSWASCDGRFSLAMQSDGNLVLYSFGYPLWATSTVGSGDIAIMQTDGNFVLYSDHSRPLFATGTDGHGGAVLAIQDDANLVVYAGATPLWASNTAGMPAAPTACGEIDPGHGLAVGEGIASCDGQHTLILQTDGNLVLYHGGAATWASGTNGAASPRRAVMQGDGNFVVYSATGALWSSRTDGHGGARLLVQDDGNVVVYVGATPIWATGTNGR